MSNKPVSAAPTNTSVFTNRLPLFILVAILVALIIYLQWPEANVSCRMTSPSSAR